MLAVLAVVGGSAGDAARGGGLVAGWAGGVGGSGDAHSGVVGIYYVWAAVGAGVGCDVVEGVVEDGENVGVELVESG